MEQYQSLINTISLTMGAAWASGIIGANNVIALPPSLELLTNPLVIGAAGIMYFVEFFADKIPAVDSTWDAVHTFIRIPLGALLAAGAVGEVNPAVTTAAFLLGGTMAAGTHAAKAGTRVLINTSPEPFTNIAASVTEDVAVVGGLWTALNYPLAFIAFIVAFALFLIWALPKLWRGIKKVFGAIARLFRGAPAPAEM